MEHLALSHPIQPQPSRFPPRPRAQGTIHIRMLLLYAAMRVCLLFFSDVEEERLMLLSYMRPRTNLSSCYDVFSYNRKGSLFSDVEEEDAVVGVAASTQTLLLPSGLVYLTALRFNQPHRPLAAL